MQALDLSCVPKAVFVNPAASAYFNSFNNAVRSQAAVKALQQKIQT
jgi:hypothetical protein